MGCVNKLSMSDNKKIEPKYYANVYAFMAAAVEADKKVQFNRTWVHNDPAYWEDLRPATPISDIERFFTDGRLRVKPEKRTVTAYITLLKVPTAYGVKVKPLTSVLMVKPTDLSGGDFVGTVTYEEEV